MKTTTFSSPPTLERKPVIKTDTAHLQADLFPAIFKVTQARGSGSCFYLKKYNLFVTNHHVVEGFRQVAIEDHSRRRYLAHVLLTNPSQDIALLKAENNFPSLPDIRLTTQEARTGEKIYVAGFPFGIPFTVTEGTVSAPLQFIDGQYRIQTDAAVNPGNSGGAMFNSKGEIVAITSSKFTNADNMGFGIPVRFLQPLLEQSPHIQQQKLNLQCSCCDAIIPEDEKYCPQCGNKLPFHLFSEPPLSELASYCEKAIKDMGILPVLARTGHESWTFHKNKSEIRIFVFRQQFLICTSPINLLPKKNFEPLLRHLLQPADTSCYQLGLEDNQIFLSYRIPLTDIQADTNLIIQKNITEIAFQADRMAHYLSEKFGCDYPEYSRK